MKNFISHHTTELVFGSDALDHLSSVITRYGRKVLLVRAPVIPPLADLYARVEGLIRSVDCELHCFDGVEPNPTTDVVSRAAERVKGIDIDVIVALGGGSSIDTAKAVALEIAYKRPCWDFRFGSETQPGPETLPVIAIPTTSGTGSEVTPVSVVTNEEENYKSIIWSQHIVCKAALLAPALTCSMPGWLTAETGFDAFAHCFESFISAQSTPMASMYAMEGMRLVAKSLVQAYETPDDLEARADMMLAATLGGLSIAETGVTLPHGMGMAIGGYCHSISHGAALALVYPEIIRCSVTEGGERYARVARLFDPSLKDDAAVQLPDIIERLLESIQMHRRLGDYQLSASQLPEMARACHEQPGWEVHPRVHSQDEML